ncbi:MAG: GNAT family N-acetyltransferase [Candidatus Heimdallarchaeota archaeon]|nr:MAG: GNAT family N-acetyltransferase [Candidatus Heimdallarchaeota archaeon]
MNEDDFQKIYSQRVKVVAKELSELFKFNFEDGLKQAELAYGRSLPQGFKTPNRFFSFITTNFSERVGYIWFWPSPESFMKDAFLIADLVIFEEFRRKGFAKQALLLLEKEVKLSGLNKIALHVFKQNKIAKYLYESVGYEVVQTTDTGYQMMKQF